MFATHRSAAAEEHTSKKPRLQNSPQSRRHPLAYICRRESVAKDGSTKWIYKQRKCIVCKSYNAAHYCTQCGIQAALCVGLRKGCYEAHLRDMEERQEFDEKERQLLQRRGLSLSRMISLPMFPLSLDARTAPADIIGETFREYTASTSDTAANRSAQGTPDQIAALEVPGRSRSCSLIRGASPSAEGESDS